MVASVRNLVTLVFRLNVLWKISLEGQAWAIVPDHLSHHVAKGGGAGVKGRSPVDKMETERI